MVSVAYLAAEIDAFAGGSVTRHRGHADDRRHDRELRARRPQEAALLDDRGDLLLQPRHREAVVVGAEAEQRQDERDLAPASSWPYVVSQRPWKALTSW